MNSKLRKNKSNKITLSVVVLTLLAVGVLCYLFVKTEAPIKINYIDFCDVGSVSCHVTNLPYQNSKLSIDTRVDDLMQRMTQSEKIGQLALIDKNSLKSKNDIAKFGLGGLLSGGGSKPLVNTPEKWLQMVEDFQSYSQKTRLAIPLLYGVDANHGHGNVFGATIFPHLLGLGASNDATLVRQVAKATAEEVLATGINWIYSPNLDVTRDTRWGRTYETFGSDSKLVARLGQAYIEGLQSVEQNGVTSVATAKHYLGNGATDWNSSINKNFFIDQGNTTLSESELRQIDLEPFRQAVKARVPSIMVGLNKWNDEKVVFNKHLLTDILRDELGFQGFVVSDWYGIYEKESDKYQALVRAINAGVDMVMLPYDYQLFFVDMQRALARGDISQTRLDEAVRRVISVKFESGLFDVTSTDSVATSSIGSKEHRELARTAVRKSLVALKNNGVLPITKSTGNILVAGSASSNIGQQSGGWTVEWQGVDGNWIPGTTILQGVQEAVSAKTKVEHDKEGNFSAKQALADIGIAVVGEKPYAEGWGDNAQPQLTDEDLATIAKLKKLSKKIVVVIISGRPLDIDQYSKDWDAVVAAWLPGSEGAGVADVLFGEYPFTGKLPVKWEL